MRLFSSPLARAGAGLAAVAVVGVLFWWQMRDGNAAMPPGNSAKNMAVPVSIGTAERRDVPHFAEGIGSVRSLQSVALRPQVEGVLAEVLFEEGQMVKKGQLLARIDDREYSAALLNAQARKASSEAQLRVAELDLQRYRNLVAEEAISRQTLEQQTAIVDQLKAAVNEADAAVTTAQVQLSYTRITSPVAGRVGLRKVDAGNLVRTSDVDGLVTVTQMSPISVLFTLPQARLSDIQQLTREHSATVLVFDREAGASLAEGRLTMVDNEIDPATGTIRLRADFTNGDGRLWPGQFVSARLNVGVSKAALVVPTRSVRQGMKGDYVYRVRDQVAEVVAVQVSWRDDDIAIITKGLDAGDTVVTDGYSRLQPGTAVKPVEPQAQETAGAVAASAG